MHAICKAMHKRVIRGHKRRVIARELANGAARGQGVGLCVYAVVAAAAAAAAARRNADRSGSSKRKYILVTGRNLYE